MQESNSYSFQQMAHVVLDLWFPFSRWRERFCGSTVGKEVAYLSKRRRENRWAELKEKVR